MALNRPLRSCLKRICERGSSKPRFACSKWGQKTEGNEFCGDGCSALALCPVRGRKSTRQAILGGLRRFSDGRIHTIIVAPSNGAPRLAPTGKSDAFTSTDGERRHLTVLSSDLIGSTEIADHPARVSFLGYSANIGLRPYLGFVQRSIGPLLTIGLNGFSDDDGS